ncbi:MAG: NAD(P)/FAD-dependent oxidoreductase, partial [Planctomycetaceae bacterium]|nr:NAD(P)/FAD-dependent oxidoreductase [Planctomycetaceae bacterium]
MKDTTHIVILGGGFAGTATALNLEKIYRRDRSVQITLIDSENFFTFTPLLAEVPSGSIQANHIVVPLRALLKRTKVKQAEVKSVDLKNRTVIAAHCEACGNESIPFDQLVVATGSVSTYFGLPGLAEHALTIKSLADATALHAHVIDKLEHADLQTDPGVRRQLLTFIVAGGGFAGVETLAELNDFVRGATKFYPHVSPDEVRMVLIHSGNRILPEVSESLSAYALKKLHSRGVEVLLETRVLSSTGHSVRLSSGQELFAETLVWAAGTAPNPILDRLDLPRTKSGKIEVDSTMAVSGHPGVWAVGDSAAIPDVVTGGLCPPTAQHALRQGKRLAHNIAAGLEGREPEPLKFKALGVLAGLGRRSAVAEILGFKFSGFFAWWLWRTIYLMKLPGFERKLRVAIDWTLDLFFPRDIVYLRPLHTSHRPGAASHGFKAYEENRSVKSQAPKSRPLAG